LRCVEFVTKRYYSVLVTRCVDVTHVRLASSMLAPAVQPSLLDSHHLSLFRLLNVRLHDIPAQVHTVPLQHLRLSGQCLRRWLTSYQWHV